MKQEPGFYPGVSFDEYASWDAVNHSKLEGFRNTPAHARHLILNEKALTKATEFGWLAHLAILEPERLWKEAVVRPNVDGRTKEGKPVLAAFKKAAAGKVAITEEERDKLKAIAQVVHEHPTAREYLCGPGSNEVSIVWKDEKTGVLCKARLDRVGAARSLPGPEVRSREGEQFMLVMDVKTIGKPATLRNFESAIYDYGYASQAAMYLEGLNRVFPADELRPFVWIVAETDPPHLVRLFTPTADLLEWGYQRWHAWLDRYAECLKTGTWPGWESGVEEANLPPWAAKAWELSL